MSYWRVLAMASAVSCVLFALLTAVFIILFQATLTGGIGADSWQPSVLTAGPDNAAVLSRVKAHHLSQRLQGIKKRAANGNNIASLAGSKKVVLPGGGLLLAIVTQAERKKIILQAKEGTAMEEYTAGDNLPGNVKLVAINDGAITLQIESMEKRVISLYPEQ